MSLTMLRAGARSLMPRAGLLGDALAAPSTRFYHEKVSYSSRDMREWYLLM